MLKHLPSMQSLKAFHAVARFSSTVKAAEYLNITPSAVSHQLRKLEGLVEVKLIRHKGRNIELTSTGNRYAKQIAQALDLIEESSFSLNNNEPYGNLCINCSSGIGTYWLSKQLGKFSRLFPNISIKLVTISDKKDVYNKDVDFSIVYGDGIWADMNVQLLHTPMFFPVCSPVLIKSMGEVSHPNDIANYPLLHFIDYGDWAKWAAMAKAKKINVNSGMIFSDINHSTSAAIAGNGISMGDDIISRETLLDGSLVKLFSIEIEGPQSYYLIASENKMKQAACAACIKWIFTEFDKSYHSS